jgi:hypothetical protein
MGDRPAADDLIYDLVSIQYHAMKGEQVYGKYLDDARGHDDVEAFIRTVKDEDATRARRCHELLSKYTRHGIDEAAA